MEEDNKNVIQQNNTKIEINIENNNDLENMEQEQPKEYLGTKIRIETGIEPEEIDKSNPEEKRENEDEKMEKEEKNEQKDEKQEKKNDEEEKKETEEEKKEIEEDNYDLN